MTAAELVRDLVRALEERGHYWDEDREWSECHSCQMHHPGNGLGEHQARCPMIGLLREAYAYIGEEPAWDSELKSVAVAEATR